MADQEESAVSILRRLEPVLQAIVVELKELRKDVVDIKVAVATKPGRGELWGGMSVMVAMFALTLAGLAVVLPMIGKVL